MLTFADIPLRIDQGYGFDPTDLDTILDQEMDFEEAAFALKTKVNIPSQLQQWIDKNFDFADLEHFAPWLRWTGPVSGFSRPLFPRNLSR